jgi:hypothetical protein
MSGAADEIVRDTSRASRIRANEVSLERSFDALARLAGETLDEPDLSVYITRLPAAYFNGVARTNLTADAADARIAMVQARLRQHGVPGTWWITPSSQPGDLEQRLLAHGFSGPNETPGMSVDLDTIADELAPAPAGVMIERVRDAIQARAYAAASAAGWDMASAMAEGIRDVVLRLDVSERSPSRLYLARLDGQPVATSLLILAGGVAGLYNVATVEHARHRGIGAAVTVAPLRDARALGYRVGVLQASALGAPIYRRLGFQDDFMVRGYEWQPD